jgi:ankyrin repeat protein
MTSRRSFVGGALGTAALVPLKLFYQGVAFRGDRQSLDLVLEFVRVGHNNLTRVKELVAQDPKLVFAAWDWGKGDWETALGGAGHIGNREIARFLLSQGARFEIFAGAMLGQRASVLALIEATPELARARGPHGYSLLYHVAISGDLDVAKAIKPLLPTDTRDFNQSLGAAVRDGHLAMTKWLFENGTVDANQKDALGRSMLKLATDKGFTDVADELRRRGAKEA